MKRKKRIVLFGGGNQASYVIDIIHLNNFYSIVGIIDSEREIGLQVCGYPIIGRQDDLLQLKYKYDFNEGIISIGDNWNRYKVYNTIAKILPHFKFINVIHPTVTIAQSACMGKGIVLMAGCIINSNANICDFSFMATGSQLEHDSSLDDFASISAGSITGGFVKIEKFAAIALGVVILDRLVIGENSLVGSGSLVLKNIPPNVVVYGNPTRIIRTRKKGDKFLK